MQNFSSKNNNPSKFIQFPLLPTQYSFLIIIENHCTHNRFVIILAIFVDSQIDLGKTMEQDFYKTIYHISEGFYKEKGSKFIAKIYHIESEDDFKSTLALVKKEYHDARHHCFAYRINPEKEQFRSSDDGEPSGTAGKPILNQILSYELFNVLVVVVRYFGGTKLGVSGLINAYKTATRDAISQSKIITKYITRTLSLHFEYPLMNDVMRIVKEEQLEVIEQLFEQSCILKIKVKKNDLEKVSFRLAKIRSIKVKELTDS